MNRETAVPPGTPSGPLGPPLQDPFGDRLIHRGYRTAKIKDFNSILDVLWDPLRRPALNFKRGGGRRILIFDPKISYDL